ncbi:TPA: CPBP family intramembrane metalloprotease [Streptococcus equi subsp. zooepidemicus]|uniref:CPBP family intramembrane metalloprotease n=1 Tax=Streptococcus equi subsp. ruminatorum TaxID=254358 RepID=A0A6M1KT35_9STRE|nr:CPBP family intramembrane glutamic endopeptidase [Streptococcus equi]MCD3415345.1 CPBP family intramembrane metalloprotease [Streptococcus equi subsp. zooepidemicus]MCD3428555.1 CPBP family intramembrane metalloprotease [Streptococcus equi subsp. zooepidemicus]MCD3455921.1 CPBP family intramembrane metalloprotease [Streptococcus equi subsp. zooepidemicus]NGL84326.1 CPBP family intramembrane metalloprotease [Streptococcus equi subsp. ruminatorum]HEL0414669.1 CPBP family intramembrane metallo
METKHSVVKVIISKLKWFGLALLVFMLEQAPTFLMTKEQPMWQTLLLVVIFLLISSGTYYLAVKLHIVGDQAIPKNDYRALWIGLGVVAVFVVKMIGGILLFLEHGPGANTVNQAALEQAGLSPILMVTLVAIVAPIVEEIVFRGLLYGKLFGAESYLGLIFSSIMFGLIHVPTDFGSWFIYGGMGLVLGFVFHKTKKVEYTILIHFLNNALAVLIMLLLPYLQ